jgi:nicotinate-nucleotide adenylyltransferase
MQRIGIYGGTFNPIHHGHLLAAQTAGEALQLSKVIFVPSCIPPLKPCPDLASGEHRLAMTRLAIAGNPLFSLSDIEVRRQHRSYTIDTVRELAALQSGGTRLFFILGADCVPKLHHWKGIDELCQLVEFAAINRPGAARADAPPPGTPPLHHITMPALELSSSLLRARLAAGKPARYFTPPAVADYIARLGLYRPTSALSETK